MLLISLIPSLVSAYSLGILLNPKVTFAWMLLLVECISLVITCLMNLSFSCHCLFDESIFPIFPIPKSESSSTTSTSSPFTCDLWFSSLLPMSQPGLGSSSDPIISTSTPSSTSVQSDSSFCSMVPV